jgi:dipeptidase E
VAERRIVVLGGGGFTHHPEDPRLEQYLLGLVGRERPRVCFAGTASGDAAAYVEGFHAFFGALGCETSELVLFGRDGRDLRRFVLGQDAIYVGGGSTANLLALWRLHGVDALMREALDGGTLLCGMSAGMNCWFEASVTDSFGPLAPLHDGLGFLKGSACPHYDSEPERRPTYLRLVTEGFPPGYAVEDSVALSFVDGELEEAVSTRADGRAYRVDPVEQALAVRVLP